MDWRPSAKLTALKQITFTLRTYKPEDDPYIYNLHVKALLSIGITPRPQSANADLNSIKAEYLDKNGDFIIAEIESKIAAYGAFLPVDEKTIEIRRMRVAPEWQRKGLGTAMLHFLLAKAKKYGFERAILNTDTRMEAAIKLYKNAGFVEVGKMFEYGEEMLLFENMIVKDWWENYALKK